MLRDLLARLFSGRTSREGNPRATDDAALGLFVLAAAGILVALLVTLGGLNWGRHLTITARFSDAT
ncbi:MAG: hypothetical protein KGR26_10490, partial [Cyanobacteria bacterium REEB65]|nr:hypothetical protein [Cyanobacteria bacterium REEB65]